MENALKHYLACYDISDNKNRLKLSKLLQFYGTRVQKSVFEIGIKNRAQLEQLKRDASPYIEEFDSLLFYRLTYASRQASHNHQDKRIAYFPATLIIS